MRCQAAAPYLKVSALFVNGDDEPVDVGDELVALSLPQAFDTLLQQLHQHLLDTQKEESKLSSPADAAHVGGKAAVPAGLNCF